MTHSPARRDLLELAGQTIGGQLHDSLLAITPSSGNTWSLTFSNPSTTSLARISNRTIPADTVVVFVGARNIDSLAFGGPGGYSIINQGNPGAVGALLDCSFN